LIEYNGEALSKVNKRKQKIIFGHSVPGDSLVTLVVKFFYHEDH